MSQVKSDPQIHAYFGCDCLALAEVDPALVGVRVRHIHVGDDQLSRIRGVAKVGPRAEVLILRPVLDRGEPEIRESHV